MAARSPVLFEVGTVEEELAEFCDELVRGWEAYEGREVGWGMVREEGGFMTTCVGS